MLCFGVVHLHLGCQTLVLHYLHVSPSPAICWRLLESNLMLSDAHVSWSREVPHCAWEEDHQSETCAFGSSLQLHLKLPKSVSKDQVGQTIIPLKFWKPTRKTNRSLSGFLDHPLVEEFCPSVQLVFPLLQLVPTASPPFSVYLWEETAFTFAVCTH